MAVSVTAISVGTGNAGNLSIQMADSLEVSGDSEIVTGAVQGSGGNIALDVGNRLLLRDSIIVTSVLGGDANSGNISINDPVFFILDTGEIQANAVAGNGGNIDITTQFLMKSVDSVIEASSQVGVDGQIDIVDSGFELNADIVPLPSDFLDAQRWLTQPCAARQGTSVSQFTVNGRDGAYRSPDDFAASPWLAGAGHVGHDRCRAVPVRNGDRRARIADRSIARRLRDGMQLGSSLAMSFMTSMHRNQFSIRLRQSTAAFHACVGLVLALASVSLPAADLSSAPSVVVRDMMLRDNTLIRRRSSTRASRPIATGR